MSLKSLLARFGVLAALALAASARADDKAVVGKVAALAGSGARYAGADALQPEAIANGIPLKVGDEVLLHDVIKLDSGNAKIVLNDASVVMLGSDSDADRKPGAFLAITEADFKDQVRSAFSAKLMWGKVWSHVTKALSGSDAKFEVTTPRAVAGVRGTIFRVDAVQFVAATKKKDSTRVRVSEGKVAVQAQVRLASAAGVKRPPKGGHTEVPGPQEISKEEWEKKFVELQKGMQVEVGEELWKESKYDSSKKDSFDDFVNKNP
jgi:hypothetical protein